ncbi:putative Lecithin-cholesterol acyl transferase [Giardia muris]|uniref:Putative Lecithin-cholesterol acyl transferase n=1 Tax=Giardia muris TaxID=5742 RepID=A0A4Z1SN12_GIAMU|nr:putative Lecithin-cholesterol acyl transferase [Giardia muris]|eukprot:TNJ27096.1 putative Lecithin-cholesterol acyl transferase [Giardia muris]
MHSTAIASERYPIILIPGVCGSKMDAVNRKTGKVERAWVSNDLFPPRMGRKFSQYLWGYPDPETEVYTSYVDQYADVRVVEGLAGCDYLIDHPIIKGIERRFPKVQLGRYFARFAERLEKEYGYVPGETLFGFAFDWRQPMYSPLVIGRLRDLIERIRRQNGGKPVLILAHSLGGIVAKAYCQHYQDWFGQIRRLITLGTPFDISSSMIYLSYLNGYALSIPGVRQLTARVIQVSSAATICLSGPPPMQAFDSTASTQDEPPQYFTPCLFIKRRCDLEPVSADTPDLTMATRTEPAQTSIVPASADIKSKTPISVDLDLERYGTAIPELPAVLLDTFLSDPTILAEDHRATTYQILLSCIKKRGVVRGMTNVEKPRKTGRYLPAVLEAKYPTKLRTPSEEALTNAAGTWEWEVFSIWPHFGRENGKKQVLHPYFELRDGRLMIRKDCSQTNLVQTLGFPKGISQSQNRDMYLLATAQLIYHTSCQLSEPLVRSIKRKYAIREVSFSSPTPGATSPLSGAKAAPWAFPGAIKEKPIYNLLERVETPGTLGAYLFRQYPPYWDRISRSRVLPLVYGGSQDALESMGTEEDKTGMIFGTHRVELATPEPTSIKPATTPETDSPNAASESKKSKKWKKTSGRGRGTTKRDEKDKDFSYLMAPCTTSEFRFISINGTGLRTAAHAIYPDPVGSYHELTQQLPIQIPGDGDGTVLLASALQDGFADTYVHDRVAVPMVNHGYLICSEGVFDLVMRGFGLRS